MSLDIEGRKCVVCDAYLFEEDDIVFCPECGAPHHRDCYKAVGSCKLGHLHGTAEQYKYVPAEKEPESAAEEKNQEKTVICPRCSETVDADAKYCPYCSERLSGGIEIQSHMRSFSFINPNEEVDENVTAKDAAEVITVNSGRYIEKFKNMKNGEKLSWNWAAFLVPHGWFAFRKMYLYAALLTAAMVAASLFTIPLIIAQNNSAVTEAANYSAALNNTIEIMLNAGPGPLLCSLAGAVLNLATRVLCGLFGDRLYKDKVISACEEIRTADDREEAVLKKGGINLFAFGLALVAETLLYQIIGGFFI